MQMRISLAAAAMLLACPGVMSQTPPNSDPNQKVRHPLLTWQSSLNYKGQLSTKISEAVRSDIPRIQFGDFALQLEALLASPSPSVRYLDFPEKVTATLPRFTAIAFPEGLEDLDIHVCIEQYNSIAGVFTINTRGRITDVSERYRGQNVPDKADESACASYLFPLADQARALKSQPGLTVGRYWLANAGARADWTEADFSAMLSAVHDNMVARRDRFRHEYPKMIAAELAKGIPLKHPLFNLPGSSGRQ